MILNSEAIFFPTMKTQVQALSLKHSCFLPAKLQLRNTNIPKFLKNYTKLLIFGESCGGGYPPQQCT